MSRLQLGFSRLYASAQAFVEASGRKMLYLAHGGVGDTVQQQAIRTCLTAVPWRVADRFSSGVMLCCYSAIRAAEA